MKKTLKTLAAVFGAALIMCTIGCSKDPEDLIIGSWDVQNIIMSRTISGLTGEFAEYNGTVCDTIAPEPGESTTLTFNKDNTCVIVNVEQQNTDTQNGTYTVVDKTLTMTIDGDAETYVIDNIDKKNMTLSVTESGTDTEAGQTYTYSYSMKINLIKK